ncbi:hypothetical protein WME75_00305 [Sorangium sp. So ce1014]|uniref:hypothetical protein n=1 Tax=Sorangium sp. So ce1014 TaxID=3133326 RepID=UPI003F5F4D4D
MNYSQERAGVPPPYPVDTYVPGTRAGAHAALQVPPSIAPVAASVPPMSTTDDLDRELEALAQGVRQKRRSRFAFVMGLLLVAGAAAAVTTFAGKVKEAEAAQAEAVAARIVEQDRIAQLNLQIEERNKKISELTLALDTAKSDAEKAQKAFTAYKAEEEAKAAAEGEDEADAKTSKTSKLSPKSAAVQRGRAAPAKAARGARAGVSAKKGGKCVCKQGDPLCGCL